MPRHDRKAYETLTARIPQALVEAVKHSASLHCSTMSDIIRESLQRYLDAERTGSLVDSQQQVLQGQTEVIQEVLQQVLQGQTEVIQEVRRLLAPWEQARDALPVQGQTEVRHEARSPEVGSAEVLQGQTEVRPQTTIPPFDPARFQLGRLCVGGHAYHGTPHTLYRLPKMVCPQCDAARARARRAAKQAAHRTAHGG